jgi:hypothetical protein
LRKEREAGALQEAIERRTAQMMATQRPVEAALPKWGTPAAKQAEIERIRKEIAKRRGG